MRFTPAIGLISFFANAAISSPVAAHHGPLTGDGDTIVQRAVDKCTPVKIIVDVLKLNKATPFCSSFLEIKTVTELSTVTSTTTATSTNVISESITITSTVSTETLSFTEYRTTATLDSVVATVTAQATSTTTQTVTPSPTTVTTTSYTTAGAIGKRSALPADMEERAIPPAIPSYLSKYAGSVVSSACSCLSVPTPTTTSTVTSTATTTATESTTTTITEIIPTNAIESTTITFETVAYNPITTTTTITATETTTTTISQPTETKVISKPFSKFCVNILKDRKLFDSIQPRRSHTYPFATTQVGTDGSEETFSKCCQLCYNTPDCTQYYTYAQSNGNWRCQVIYSTSSVNVELSPTCPKGVIAEDASNPTGTFTPGSSRGLGPCYDPRYFEAMA